MGKYIADGVIQTRYAATLANPAAPTLAEWNAAIDLTPFMRALDTPLGGSTADAAGASSKFNKTVAGTYGGQDLTGEFMRDKVYASDTAWRTLPRGTGGYLLVARRGGTGASNAMQAGDRVDVWEIDVHTRNPIPYARNRTETLAIAAGVPSEPNEDVALV